MTDYRASADIDADTDAVFTYLSDVGNLPRYFDRMTAAEPRGTDEVHTTAQVDGHTEEGDAWFKVDSQDHTVSWGSEGPNHYHGRLLVSERGLGTSVAVTLSTDHVAGTEIQEGLERTVATIKRLCEASR